MSAVCLWRLEDGSKESLLSHQMLRPCLAQVELQAKLAPHPLSSGSQILLCNCIIRYYPRNLGPLIAISVSVES